MRTNLLSLFLSVFAVSTLSAQTADKFCGTTERHKELVEQHPEILEAEKQLEAHTRQFAMAKSGDDTTVYTIPVVFHVVHNYGVENISDEQILSAIEVLNRDYDAANPDLSGIIEEFQPLIADMNIQFKLATKDIYGNCTNGIDRIPSLLTYDGGNSAVKINPWPRESYLNVWVVNSMNSGVAGYALYPSAVNSQVMRPLDGIVVLHDYVGNIGTSGEGSSRTLSHEVGHWLNLAHVWGSTNDPGVACGDDGVSDTPMTKGYDYCPTSPEQAMICNDTIVENYQNFMEYSYCPSHMFTLGQKERVRAALTSDIGNRNLLSTDFNLGLTGVSEGNEATCSPMTEFYPNRLYACMGDEVKFFANTTRAIAENYNWEFSNANIETSSEANPTVTFNSAGWQTVTLTVSNEYGETTHTDEKAVYISDPNTNQFTNEYYQPFYGPEVLENEWIEVNRKKENVTHWEWSGAGYTYGSMKLTAYDQTGMDVDQIISPSFDLTNTSGLIFSFKYAFATQLPSEQVEAKLVVYSSYNCGESWQPRLTIEGGDLLTAGFYEGVPFTPGVGLASEWKTAQFAISGLQTQYDNLRYKFEFTADAGSNNLYIDEVQIGSIVSDVETLKSIHQVKVYPNPATEKALLEYNLNTTAEVAVSVTDISGRTVLQLDKTAKAAGKYSDELNISDLSSGMYFVKLEIGNQVMTQKLTIE